MSKAPKWSNVEIAVQSALAVPVALTAITKANPGVASAAAHGFVNGDFVLLSVYGMREVDKQVVRVANETTDSFELEGVNTTGFGTFTSGTVQKITLGLTMATAVGLSGEGGEYDFEDITTLHDNKRRQTPNLPSAVSYKFENLWDVADPTLLAFKAASDAQTPLAVKFRFANGQFMIAYAMIGCSMIPVGSAQQSVKTNVVMTFEGEHTVYAS